MTCTGTLDPSRHVAERRGRTPGAGVVASPTSGLDCLYTSGPGGHMTSEYEITLRGLAGPTVLAAFADFDVHVEGQQTVLRGEIQDQAALHGVLDRLRALGIEIVEVRCIQPKS